MEVAHVTLTRTPLSRSKGQRSTCCWCLKSQHAETAPLPGE